MMQMDFPDAWAFYYTQALQAAEEHRAEVQQPLCAALLDLDAGNIGPPPQLTGYFLYFSFIPDDDCLRVHSVDEAMRSIREREVHLSCSFSAVIIQMIAN